MRKTIVVLLTVVLMAVPAYAGQLPSPVSSVADKIFTLYNKSKEAAIYKDLASKRFQSSADAAAFTASMTELHKLGKAGSKEELFVIKDYYAADKSTFYRVAFNVKHDKGIARHYLALVQMNNEVKLDGWAIIYGNKALLAQGNLYNLPLDKDSKKSLLSVIPLKALKDSKTEELLKKKKEVMDKRREMIRPAFEAGAKGDFKQARELFAKAGDKNNLMILNDVDKKIVKPNVAQNIFKSLLEISKDNWPEAKKHIEQALNDDKNYWPAYAVASSVEQRTTKDKDKIAAYATKLTSGLKEVVNNSCQKSEPVKGKVVEHCHVNLLSNIEWTKINGKLEGELKVYDKDGHLTMKSNYTHDVLDGRQEYYFPSGKLAGWKQYENGVLKKTQQMDENGKIIYEQDSSLK